MRQLASHRSGLFLALFAAIAVAAAAWAGDDDNGGSFDPAFKGVGKIIVPIHDTTDAPKPASPAGAPATGPADKKAAMMTQYYMGLFTKGLESPDWVARSMSVISLGRIDDPQITEKLLEVAAKNDKPLVRVYAWEALHARNPSLTPEQRKKWLDAGKDLIKQNLLRGQLRMAVVALMKAEGPTAENQKRFMDLFNTTNSLDPGDVNTLTAMQDCLGTWKAPDIVKQLVEQMGNLDNAYRAEYVLEALGSGIAEAATHADKGSDAMWKETQAAWVKWVGGANLEAAKTGGEAYTGQSRMMPAPERITDSHDAKWRKDLELGRVTLDQLDIGFCVDATGSMGEVVAWVKRDVSRLMRAFGMVSREPRIGVTFYRDHGDEFVTRTAQLTDKADQLAATIAGMAAKGGGDEPEAVFEGLKAIVNENKWSGSDRAKKVIVLVGDAMPHSETTGEIQKLLEAQVKLGFRLFCVKCRTRYGSQDLSSFDQMAEWGKGKAIDMPFDERATYNASSVGIAMPKGDENPYDQVVAEILKLVLPAGYHDRVDTFVAILMQYVDEPVVEKRKAFPPRPPPKPYVPPVRGPGGGGGGGPGERVAPPPPPKPVKPFDPQAR